MDVPKKKHVSVITPAQRQQLEEIAQLIAQRIGLAVDSCGMKDAVGFVLSVYTYNAVPPDKGFMTWVSSGQRADTIKALRELADAMEAGKDSTALTHS